MVINLLKLLQDQLVSLTLEDNKDEKDSGVTSAFIHAAIRISSSG